jgi:hypothetical protein
MPVPIEGLEQLVALASAVKEVVPFAFHGVECGATGNDVEGW